MHISVVINQKLINYNNYGQRQQIYLFSLLDLKTSSGAPEQELTLHTTFGKNAKRPEHLSANIPRWIIELSVRQWRIHAW